MLKRISLEQIPKKRKTSVVTQAAYREFEQLKEKLAANPLAPYQAEMFVLDVKAKPTTLKNAMTKIYQEAKEYIALEKLPYDVVTRRLDDNSLALYVVGQ